MLSLYTTENIISSIFKDNENRYDAWYEFIIKLRPSMRVLLNNNTDYDDNDYNPLYLLQKDYDLDVEAEYNENDNGNSYIAQVIAMKLDSISNPQSVFVLDIDKETADTISLKYGIICQSFKEEPSKSPLFQEGLEKNVEEGDGDTGWNDLLIKNLVTPSNSLIFVDRYLFSRDRNGVNFQDGIDNVYSILNKILPESLGVDYYVLVIFDASTITNDDNGTFERISKRLNSLKKRLDRPYNIIIETLSITRNDMYYDKTHNRRILSNYFIIRADHSLKAFKNTDSIYSQSIFLDWAASRGVINSKNSDAPAKALYKCIKGIQEAINQLKRSIGPVPYSLNGNKNISIKEIQNKLINYTY